MACTPSDGHSWRHAIPKTCWPQSIGTLNWHTNDTREPREPSPTILNLH